MARPASLPAGNTGHAFWANLTHAWTFHATGNTGGADADDIPGTLDATLSGAVLSDTLGLDCDPETDLATISRLTLTTNTAFSVMWRSKLDADNGESMVMGRTDDGTGFVWSNNSGAVMVRMTGNDVTFAGASGKTVLTDYCFTCDGGGASANFALFTKAASGTDWASAGTGSLGAIVDFIVEAFGAGFNSNTLWLQGELEYVLTLNTQLDETELDASFADPYSILAAAGGGTTSGRPFGTRGRAFNGGRPFAGAMR